MLAILRRPARVTFKRAAAAHSGSQYSTMHPAPAQWRGTNARPHLPALPRAPALRAGARPQGALSAPRHERRGLSKTVTDAAVVYILLKNSTCTSTRALHSAPESPETVPCTGSTQPSVIRRQSLGRTQVCHAAPPTRRIESNGHRFRQAASPRRGRVPTRLPERAL
jgi:hypothetical protein